MKQEKVGVLLVNLGTPEAPTEKAVRKYLAEFLSDRRVVEIPRLIWLPILYGFILRTRPRRSAEAYASIWTEAGSPLLAIAHKQAAALQLELDYQFPEQLRVRTAMRYGQPSIDVVMGRFAADGIKRILVLPQYPQYSATTTASVFDAVAAHLKKQRDQPELRWIRSYAVNEGYIGALVESIQEFREKHGRGEKLLFSFHGLPKRNVVLGDPYFEECKQTAEKTAKFLRLKAEDWVLCFQSRFGKAEWLQPYTDQVLENLAAKGVKKVDVVCPGFAADCLETLEEIDQRYKNKFLAAGGTNMQYIGALNDGPAHIDMLVDLISNNIAGWVD